MLTKAGDAIEAAFQKWNKRNWNFLRGTHTFATVAPFSVASVTTTSGGTGITAADLSSLVVGDVVSGVGIRAETYVISIDLVASPDAAVLSQPASASGTVTLNFARRDYVAPTNLKFIYNMRNLTEQHTVFPVYSRMYDLISPDQLTQDAPLFYDPHPLGADGKIRFLPTPGGIYIVEMKYHRRMTVPSVDGTALDIPIDFEWGILAHAKAIFLAEKGGYNEVAAMWRATAKEEFVDALKSDAKDIDSSEGFLPGYLVGHGGGVADTVAETDISSGWGSDWGSDWGA